MNLKEYKIEDLSLNVVDPEFLLEESLVTEVTEFSPHFNIPLQN